MSVTDKKYSYLEMEAALCVWEELSHPQYDDYREARGGGIAFRETAVTTGQYCLKVYELCKEEVEDIICYDYVFIPAVLKHIDFGANVLIYPDAQVVARDIARQILQGNQSVK